MKFQVILDNGGGELGKSDPIEANTAIEISDAIHKAIEAFDILQPGDTIRIVDID